ncbi:MAG: hypothetical protein Kow0026_27350 [Oricola sp.]
MTESARSAIARFIALVAMIVVMAAFPAAAENPGSRPAASAELAAASRQAGKISNPQIHFLRGGFAGVFSTGLDEMARQLAREGIRAQVSGWTSARSVTSKITRAFKADNRAGPVILAGHSLGAGAVIDIANHLTAKGIPVDLLIVFDTLGAPPVPKGVRKFISFKASGNRKSAGRFHGAPGFDGRIINIDIRTLPGLDDSTHWNMVFKKDLQSRVMREIENTLQVWKPGGRS